MKKLIFYSVLILCLLYQKDIYSQATNLFPTSGNVGIGTTSPTSKLDVVGNFKITTPELSTIYEDGLFNVNANSSKINFLGNKTTYGNSYISFGYKSVKNARFQSQDFGNIYYPRIGFKLFSNIGSNDYLQRTGSIGLTNFSSSNIYSGIFTINFGRYDEPRIFINVDGWVSIGTTTPLSIFTVNGKITSTSLDVNEKICANSLDVKAKISSTSLDVNGNIKAKEVEITLVGWADDVFKQDYKLRSLHDVEEFIKTNSHLPEIPSEKEVMEKGISLGDMNAKLLKKIEEQMLYILELNKRVEVLENNKSK